MPTVVIARRPGFVAGPSCAPRLPRPPRRRRLYNRYYSLASFACPADGEWTGERVAGEGRRSGRRGYGGGADAARRDAVVHGVVSFRLRRRRLGHGRLTRLVRHARAR